MGPAGFPKPQMGMTDLLPLSCKDYIFFTQNFIQMTALEDQIRGNWKQIRGKLKEKYGELSDDDLKYTEGKEDQLIGRLQSRLGQNKHELKRTIDSL